MRRQAGKSRITRRLLELREQGRSALVPFFSVGDPDMETSYRVITAAARAGADLIELGVPFSDPMADGPVIQASSQRALAAGCSMARVFELVRTVRRVTDVPLVLFGYYNPFFRYGDAAIAADARTAGVDGILCVDLPPEEAGALLRGCRRHGIDRVFLLAPTSDEGRIRTVARVASGFVYLVAVTGVTGARAQAPAGIESLVGRVRKATGLPVGVGFGISTPEQAVRVARYADLVIVGSALVQTLHEAGSGRAEQACTRFVSAMRRALDETAVQRAQS